MLSLLYLWRANFEGFERFCWNSLKPFCDKKTDTNLKQPSYRLGSFLLLDIMTNQATNRLQPDLLALELQPQVLCARLLPARVATRLLGRQWPRQGFGVRAGR